MLLPIQIGHGADGLSSGYFTMSFPSVLVYVVFLVSSMLYAVLGRTQYTINYTMYISSLVLLSAFAAQAVAVPVQADHAVHERRDYVPNAWVKRGRLDAAAILPVRIGMTQSNLEKGYDLLLEV